MTVKSLTTEQKAAIAVYFQAKQLTIPELATRFNKSTRTIVRVLEEQGVDPGIKRRTQKAKPVPVVIPTKTPWWRRIINGFKFTYGFTEQRP